jgi:hypothetical protein
VRALASAILGLVVPLAHVGHWALWVLYAIPVVIVLGSIVVNWLRERRQRHPG